MAPLLLFVTVALVGLCVGSFLNVVIHRVPKMLERGWREQCAELSCWFLDRNVPPVDIRSERSRTCRS